MKRKNLDTVACRVGTRGNLVDCSAMFADADAKRMEYLNEQIAIRQKLKEAKESKPIELTPELRNNISDATDRLIAHSSLLDTLNKNPWGNQELIDNTEKKIKEIKKYIMEKTKLAA